MIVMSLARLVTMMQKLEREILPKEEVLAAFYGGSIGGGIPDEYSDIDFYIVVEDGNFSSTFDSVPDMMRELGKIYFIIDRSHSNEWAFFFEKDFFEIDFGVRKVSELKPELKYREIIITKDNEGLLAGLQKRSREMEFKIVPKHFKAWFEEIRHGQIYTARHCARGWVQSAYGEAIYEGEQLFYLLAKLRGIPNQHGFRNAENFLTQKEMNMLLATRPGDSTIEDIRKAIKANWELLKYVEREFEKKTSENLDIKCYDAELLKVADEIYRKCKNG
jgi:hypothetical protein